MFFCLCGYLCIYLTFFLHFAVFVYVCRILFFFFACVVYSYIWTRVRARHWVSVSSTLCLISTRQGLSPTPTPSTRSSLFLPSEPLKSSCACFPVLGFQVGSWLCLILFYRVLGIQIQLFITEQRVFVTTEVSPQPLSVDFLNLPVPKQGKLCRNTKKKI